VPLLVVISTAKSIAFLVTFYAHEIEVQKGVFL
jgi:hypothetical protein